MSTNRIARNPIQKQGKGPNGRGFCKGCEKEVPKGRRCWCSKECVEEQLIRSSPAHASYLVAKRDLGVCALCQIDTARLGRIMKMAEETRLVWKGYPRRLPSMPVHEFRQLMYGQITRRLLRKMGFTKPHLWEMDHIVPVSEGGGECGLDNLRTLCIPCHKKETAELRGRLAEDARRKRTGATQLSFA